MKKLMMVLAAVAMAASVQASAFSWSISATGPICLPGSDYSELSSAQVYLFADSALKSTIVEAFAAGTLNLGNMGAIKDATLDTGVISATPFSYGSDGQSNTYWMALVADVEGEQMLYISNDKSASGVQGKTTKVAFNTGDTSIAAAMDAANGFAGAGWYSAVPEPTSGLLMLLGMAGLALRRRRA